MIKLNNKNITYVALADSNNSLKAPKEIWYADSNNSVKLVYKRKDALIEGEDYEKYHWLRVETGMQNGYYMSLPMSTNFSFTRKYLSDWSNTWYYWTPNYVYYTDSHKLIQIYDSINRTLVDSGDTSTMSIGDTINIISTPDLLLFNGKTINRYNYAASRAQFCIYNTNRQIITSLNSTITVNNSMRYIPCKLLKPVPKWLDANGIRRNVGECGMIDLVSGKFYGNVNSVGTFTVENYYERKEWLVGDGSAYIDTGHNVNEDLDYETKVHLLPNTYLFWYRSGNPYRDQTMAARSDTSQYIGVRTAKNSVDVRADDTANVEIQWNNNEVLVNGVNYTPSNRAITFNYELYLFYAYLADTSIADYSSNNVKCAYFRFLDSNRDYIQNLIPCTLTMDLPASMDANNIARTKGTSGMWDLVSDKFYGNVASSGTFKAVNLAEGVDYEVHDWLKGDGTAYIVNKYNLWNNNVETRSAKINLQKTENNDLVYTDINGLNWAIQQNPTLVPQLMVNFREEGAGVHILEVNPTHDTFELKFYKKNGYAVCLFDGIEHQGGTMTESKWNKDISPRIYSYKMSYIREVLPNGSYRSNLVPCRLLRPIPAELDANCIARSVGECGMYDTVNDVFYGNVASSGTFSVSDDS